MCGLDIDVPEIDWNRSPFGVAPEMGGRSPNGELPARIWRPGAVMSGLMMSLALGFGPRDEKIVIDGSYLMCVFFAVSVIFAVGLVRDWR